MLAGVLVSLEVVCNRKSPKEGNTSTFRNCSPCFAERPSATSGFDGKLSSSLFVTVLVLLEDPLQQQKIYSDCIKTFSSGPDDRSYIKSMSHFSRPRYKITPPSIQLDDVRS